MKRNKLFKAAVTVLTSLALVLSTSMVTWAASASVSGVVSGVGITGKAEVSGQKCTVTTTTANGDPSIWTYAEGVISYRLRTTGETDTISMSPVSATGGVMTTLTLDSKYQILLLTGYFGAEHGSDKWSNSVSVS